MVLVPSSVNDSGIGLGGGFVIGRLGVVAAVTVSCSGAFRTVEEEE